MAGAVYNTCNAKLKTALGVNMHSVSQFFSQQKLDNIALNLNIVCSIF